MSRNRVTVHRGKGYAKHNQHDFMDEDFRAVKVYMVYQKSLDYNDDDLNDYELAYYNRRYGNALKAQNERYEKKRNYDRVKTMEDWYKSKRYSPTEEIIQYGHMMSERLPNYFEFNKMIVAYVNWKIEWSHGHGNHLHVLDASGHFDEATPHCHLREIWDCKDKNGNIVINQEKAMELSGLELPNPSAPVGKNNNRQMTYTKMCREKWQEICEQFGFEVERTPLDSGRWKHESVADYHKRMAHELEDAFDNFETGAVGFQKEFEESYQYKHARKEFKDAYMNQGGLQTTLNRINAKSSLNNPLRSK